MFKFSQCPLLCDIYILHILGSFFILELTKTLLRVKNKSNKSNHKKYNCETNTMVFLLSNKHLPLNEHCILPRATCTKYVIEDFLMVYHGKINKWTFDHFCHATESGYHLNWLWLMQLKAWLCTPRGMIECSVTECGVVNKFSVRTPLLTNLLSFWLRTTLLVSSSSSLNIKDLEKVYKWLIPIIICNDKTSLSKTCKQPCVEY